MSHLTSTLAPSSFILSLWSYLEVWEDSSLDSLYCWSKNSCDQLMPGVCLYSQLNLTSTEVELCFQSCRKALQSVARPWRVVLRSSMQQPVLMTNRCLLWTFSLPMCRQCCNAWHRLSLARPAGTLRMWGWQSGMMYQRCKRWETLIHTI